jgi:hypothetical protein
MPDSRLRVMNETEKKNNLGKPLQKEQIIQ